MINEEHGCVIRNYKHHMRPSFTSELLFFFYLLITYLFIYFIVRVEKWEHDNGTIIRCTYNKGTDRQFVHQENVQKIPPIPKRRLKHIDIQASKMHANA